MRLLIVFVTLRFIMLKKYFFKRKLICFLLLTLGTLKATGRINQQYHCVVKNIRVYEDAAQQSSTQGKYTVDFFSRFFFS